jgi:FkbM family methyltransferase
VKLAGGCWFTDEEAHFPAWIENKNQLIDGRLAYQGHKLMPSLEYCRQFRTAVDVGGHVGTFSFYLAKRFERVHSFEPVARFRECFVRNVEAQNVELHPFALGAAPAMVGMHIVPEDTGGTYVSGVGDVQMVTLDSLGLEDVDYLKIDCEGAEEAVILGGMETIKRCRPVCMVEQKQKIMGRNYGTAGTPAVDRLVELGARVVREISGDFILVF